MCVVMVVGTLYEKRNIHSSLVTVGFADTTIPILDITWHPEPAITQSIRHVILGQPHRAIEAFLGGK
jgi:hypothetical protein